MIISGIGNQYQQINFFDKTMVNFNNFEINIRNILLKNINRKYTDIVTDWEKKNESWQSFCSFNGQDLLEITIYKGTKKKKTMALIPFWFKSG